MNELVARLRAVVRRARPVEPDTVIRSGSRPSTSPPDQCAGQTPKAATTSLDPSDPHRMAHARDPAPPTRHAHHARRPAARDAGCNPSTPNEAISASTCSSFGANSRSTPAVPDTCSPSQVSDIATCPDRRVTQPQSTRTDLDRCRPHRGHFTGADRRVADGLDQRCRSLRRARPSGCAGLPPVPEPGWTERSSPCR